MSYSIHKYITAVILAGAMILFAGFAVQTVHAEGDEYSVGWTLTDNTVSQALPGIPYELNAQFFKNGEKTAFPEGAKCVWETSVMPGPGLTEEDVKNYNIDLQVDEEDTTRAQITFADFSGLPDGVDSVLVGLSVTVFDAEGAKITGSDSGQIDVVNEFYEVLMPHIDPNMLVQQPQEVCVEVMRHKLSKDATEEEVTLVDAVCTWKNTDPYAEVTPGASEPGKYSFTITRLRADADYDDLCLEVNYGAGSSEQHFPLYQYSINLPDCGVGITKGTYHYVYYENYCFIDEAAAKAAGEDPSLGVENVCVQAPEGEFKQAFNDKLFTTEVEKYTGYNESTYEDNYKKGASFPLKFDPAGSKDSNGYWTRGTSLYRFKLIGKEGSGWVGETEWMYVYVCSKNSLFLLQNNYGGGYLTFSGLNKYWSFSNERYEVPYGSKASKALTVKIGKDTLKMKTDYTATYTNDYDKSKKYVNKFPTAAGTYTLEVKGVDPYYGYDKSIHLKVGKKNPMTVKGKTLKVKAKKKKVKKTKTYKAAKAFTVKKAQGKVTYKKVSGNKKITVAGTGKVTVKKGLKKGTYKVKVKVRAAGNDRYFPLTKTVTFKVKVK